MSIFGKDSIDLYVILLVFNPIQQKVWSSCLSAGGSGKTYAQIKQTPHRYGYAPEWRDIPSCEERLSYP